MMFFSIVIPTYNRASFINKTIQSILKQTYNHYEIIVVDDGSTDNTEEVVKAINDTRIIYYKKINAERGAARNYGATKAKGDYINFFDSDDLALPNHLETASDFIKQHNQPEVFHLNYQWSSSNQKNTRKINHISGDLNKQLMLRNPLSCNGVFIRKDIIALNYFNEERSLSASEDWELWIRLASQYNFQYSNTVTSIVIDHEGRSVLNIEKDKLIKRKKLFLKIIFENNATFQFVKKYKNKIIANSYSYISLHLAMAGYKKDSINYLFKSIITSPRNLFKKRFLATCKHLLK